MLWSGMQISIYLENKIVERKRPCGRAVDLGHPARSTLFHHDSHLGRLRNFLLPMFLYLPSVDSLATRVKKPDPEEPSENHSGGLWYHQFALFSLAS